MPKLKGKDILIYIDGHAVAAARSCEIQKDTEILEVSSSSDNTSSHFVSGRYRWNVVVSGLVVTPNVVLQSGTAATMTCRIASEPNLTLLTGNVICNSAKVTATIGNLAQMSCSFQGNGPLTGLS